MVAMCGGRPTVLVHYVPRGGTSSVAPTWWCCHIPIPFWCCATPQHPRLKEFTDISPICLLACAQKAPCSVPNWQSLWGSSTLSTAANLEIIALHGEKDLIFIGVDNGSNVRRSQFRSLHPRNIVNFECYCKTQKKKRGWKFHPRCELKGHVLYKHVYFITWLILSKYFVQQFSLPLVLWNGH